MQTDARLYVSSDALLDYWPDWRPKCTLHVRTDMASIYRVLVHAFEEMNTGWMFGYIIYCILKN